MEKSVLIRPFDMRDRPEALAKLIPLLTANIVQPRNLVERISRLPFINNAYWQVAQSVFVNNLVAMSGILFFEGRRAVIEEVVVDPRYRKQGICGRMMELLILAAREKEVREIRLVTGNPSAERIYAKLGFRVQMAGTVPAKVLTARFSDATFSFGPTAADKCFREAGLDYGCIPSKGWVASALWPDDKAVSDKVHLARKANLCQFKMLVQDPNLEMVCSEFGFARNPPKEGHDFEKVMALKL